MDYLSKSQKETENLAAKFLSQFPELNLIGLSGDLGSGKTAFVRGLAKVFKIKKNITSPTFVIEKRYSGIGKNLVHIDAYRLKSIDDLQAIGFSESIDDKKNLIAIEWPENVFKKKLAGMKIINFKYVNENQRKISW